MMIWNKTECELVMADLAEMLPQRIEVKDMSAEQREGFLLGVAMLHGEIKRKLVDYV